MDIKTNNVACILISRSSRIPSPTSSPFPSNTLAHLIPGNPFKPNTEPHPWIPITSAGPGQPEPDQQAIHDVHHHLTPARDLIAAIAENRSPLRAATDTALTVALVTAVFESHRQNATVPFSLEHFKK